MDQQSNLFARYFSGNASPEEEKQLMQWIEADPAHRQAFKQARKIWEIAGNLKEAEIDFDTQSQWEQFRLLIAKEAKRPSRFAARQMLMMAAAMVLLTGLFFALEPLFDKAPLPKKTAPAATVITTLEITTQDSSKVFFLPDSSKVFLNRNSSLSYPLAFANDRNATLCGEAFFEVRHDSLHPFAVHTSGTTVRVLGTSFNIRESNNNEVFVGVVSGKVVFSSDRWPKDSTVVLKANESGTFNKERALFSKTKNTDAVWKAEKKQNFIKRTINKIRQRLRQTK